MSEAEAREALGDARPHWFNKQGDDCGPLPFTAEELKLLNTYRDEIRREVLDNLGCFDDVYNKAVGNPPGNPHRSICQGGWLCPIHNYPYRKEGDS